MDHVAIMNPKMRSSSNETGMIEKILSGEKTIESRWLKNHAAPWKKVGSGDVIYFKYAGNPIIAKAVVRDVEYIEPINPDFIDARLPVLASAIGLDVATLRSVVEKKSCGVLIELDRAQTVTPFDIDKRGFGAMAAWITVDSIETIRL